MLIWYDDQRKLGSDGFKKEKKVYLGQQLEKRFEECESRNESAKKSQKVEIGYLKSKIIGTFKANLKTSTEGKYLEEEDLKEVLQKWESEAIESFEKETKQFHPELVKGLRKDFKIEMEAERKYIEERNQEMKDAAFYKCGKKQNDAVEKYKTNIENCIKKTPCQDQRDLEVRHDRYKDEAMKEFEKFKEVPLDYFNEQKKKLEEKIQDLFEKAECQNKDNVERKIDAIVADARADFLKEINAFYDGRGALIFVDAILKPLLDIIEKFACGKETKSSTEFYKEHVSKTKFNEIHEKLLKMKCDAVQDQIQGPQNQAEAMKRIEAALYEIGRKIFFAAACLALLQSTLIAGVTGAGVATGAAIGSFGGPIGTSIGTGIGAIAGFAAGMGAADSLEKLFWRWVERI